MKFGIPTAILINQQERYPNHQLSVGHVIKRVTKLRNALQNVTNVEAQDTPQKFAQQQSQGGMQQIGLG